MEARLIEISKNPKVEIEGNALHHLLRLVSAQSASEAENWFPVFSISTYDKPKEFNFHFGIDNRLEAWKEQMTKNSTLNFDYAFYSDLEEKCKGRSFIIGFVGDGHVNIKKVGKI